MVLPISLRLKRRSQRELAQLQDEVADLQYSVAPQSVLHGGTAIWRCFQGNRFSEDLDFYYLPSSSFESALREHATKQNLSFTKFRKTSRAIYARVARERVEVSLEISLRAYPSPSVQPFERCDGTSMDILTPSSSALVVEKLHAFRNRRLIRDIYDVFHLSKRIEPTPALTREMVSLLTDLPSPLDESNLSNLILSGITPSFSQMVDYLHSRWRP